MFACLKEFTEKTQVLLEFISSKKDQCFTKNLTLTLHEDFESEVSGTSRQIKAVAKVLHHYNLNIIIMLRKKI